MITREEIVEKGYYHCQGIPEHNWRDAVDKSVEENTEDFSEVEDYYNNLCYEAELGSREYSPFEFTPRDLNDLENDESIDFEVWEAFEEGISKYIEEYWNENEWEIRGYFEELIADKEEEDD